MSDKLDKHILINVLELALSGQKIEPDICETVELVINDADYKGFDTQLLYDAGYKQRSKDDE